MFFFLLCSVYDFYTQHIYKYFYIIVAMHRAILMNLVRFYTKDSICIPVILYHPQRELSRNWEYDYWRYESWIMCLNL